METDDGAVSSTRTRIRMSSSRTSNQSRLITPFQRKEKNCKIALHILTLAKQKLNADVKPVENLRIVDEYFSQRTKFDKIQEQIDLSLSS